MLCKYLFQQNSLLAYTSTRNAGQLLKRRDKKKKRLHFGNSSMNIKFHLLFLYFVTIFSGFGMLRLHFTFWSFFFFVYVHYFTCAVFSIIFCLNALLLVATEL